MPYLKLGIDFPLTSLVEPGISDSGSSTVADFGLYGLLGSNSVFSEISLTY